MHYLPSLPTGILPLSNSQGSWVREHYPNLRDLPEGCPTCHGRGAFRWYGPDGQVSDWQCSCADQWVLHRFLLHAGLGDTYQRLGWRDCEMDQGVTGLVRWWMDHSDDAIAKGLGMILHGSVGGGKTLLATLVLRHVLTSHPGFFTTYSGLLDMLMSSWHSQEDRDRFYRLIRNCTVLVIDDLGRERKQQRIVSAAESAATGSDRGVVQYSSALAESTFEEVVRHRVASSLPTIITTNLNPERIGQGYGGNAASLLMERSMLIEVQGEDYRTRSASRMMDEIEMGLTRPVVLG